MGRHVLIFIKYFSWIYIFTLDIFKQLCNSAQLLKEKKKCTDALSNQQFSQIVKATLFESKTVSKHSQNAGISL